MNLYLAWGKRMFDFAASTGGLLILWPILVLLAVILILRDGQNPIFIQKRVGRDGATFTLFKLRTMPKPTPDLPSHEIDPSMISKFGQFLRKSRLDELPQLFNVVTGSMSLVGPRPCLPSQSTLIDERKARGVLKMRPGITGLSQIRGLDMSNPEKLARMDAEYAEPLSFNVDLAILFRTFVPNRR